MKTIFGLETAERCSTVEKWHAAATKNNGRLVTLEKLIVTKYVTKPTRSTW